METAVEAAPAKREQKAEKPAQLAKNNSRSAQKSSVRPEVRNQNESRSNRERQKPVRSERPRAAAVQKDEDPGLLLISRKPPAQKFANFEEYMKSRGGFSEMAEGESDE